MTEPGKLRAMDRDIRRKMLVIALPVVANNLIETLYNLVDAFFLGKLGTAEISAPSISFSIMLFLIVFGTGISGAGTTLIAQAKGRDDREKANFYMNQTATFLLFLSLFLMVIGLALSKPLLVLLGTPPEVFGYTLVFMRISFMGVPFMFAYYVLLSSFTAVGDSFTALWVHLIGIGVNVLLDPFLIFGIGPFPRLGVAGAAIATVFSQVIVAVLSVIILSQGRHGLRLSLAAMKPRRDAFRLLAEIGLPSSLGQAISSLGFTVLQGLVNGFGASAIAAFGVGNRITGLFDIPARGIANAATALAGQALGAGDEDRSRRIVRISLIACIVFMTPLLTAAFFFGGDLVRFFVNDAEAIRLGDIMFKVTTPSVLLFGLYLVITGAFQGAGATRIIMVLSIVRLWVLRVPLAYALAAFTSLGPLSIWYAMFVSNAGTALAGFIHYKGGRWLKALEGRKI
jgi:putative MATE family efflux protein